MGYGAKGDRIWGEQVGNVYFKGKTTELAPSETEKVIGYGVDALDAGLLFRPE